MIDAECITRVKQKAIEEGIPLEYIDEILKDVNKVFGREFKKLEKVDARSEKSIRKTKRKLAKEMYGDANLTDSLPDELIKKIEDKQLEVDQKLKVIIRNKILSESRVKDFFKFAEDYPNFLKAGVKFMELVHAKHIGLRNKTIGEILYDLKEANILEHFHKKSINELNVAKELREINNPEGKFGETGDEVAIEFAKVINKYQKQLVNRRNRAGAYIKDRVDYITRQTHDIIKINKAGNEKWIPYIKDRLDLEETFDQLDFGADDIDTQINDELGRLYNDLSTGNHDRVKEDGSILLGNNTSNLAKKISAERKLHFKSAEDWFEYNQMFGNKSLIESLFYQVDTASKELALLESFGPNPKAAYQEMIRRAKEKIKSDPEQWKKISGRRGEFLGNMFNNLVGVNDFRVDGLVGKIGLFIRSIENMSKLGAVLLSQPTDIGFSTSVLSSVGMDFLPVLRSNVLGVFKGRRSGEMKELAHTLGIGMDSLLGGVLSRFSVLDNELGSFSKSVEGFFKFTGMNWWTDTVKTSAGLMYSNWLGKNAGKLFDELHPELQTTLKRYGIKSQEWDLVRTFVDTAEDGNVYLTPDSVKKISDDTLRNMLKRSGDTEQRLDLRVQRYRDKLDANFRGMVIDIVDTAVPTPGLKEKTIMNQGTQAGTWLGEGIRLFAQFKSFPTTILSRVIPTLYEQGGAGLVSKMILTTTSLGYISTVLKDIASGREPIDPREYPIKTGIRALTQGGGLGIFADFLFGLHSRYGSGAIEAFMGPSFDSASQLYHVFEEFRDAGIEGDELNVSSSIINFVRNHTPYANLFYARIALNNILWTNLHEFFNPGYTRKMKRRVKRETGQDFWIQP